ncbi:MAG: hypothetical protein SFX74_11790 [Fimbriimonadaceae bacterium]|nr:hypothetical protein [Fimbriimonadaceae bacterium]
MPIWIAKLPSLPVLPPPTAPSRLAAVPNPGDRTRFELHLEPAWISQSLNDVRVPGNGTNVPFDRLAGGTQFGGRLTLRYAATASTGWRAVIAPYRATGRGRLSEPTSFDGAVFAPGVDTDAEYEFNSYRLTYFGRWRVRDPRAELTFGYTLKARDAVVGLRQGNLRRRFSNFGLVPLLHIGGRYRFSERFALAFDFDGLVATQGRALDLGLFLETPVARNLDLRIGGRVVDGGADNDRTRNVALITSYGIGLNYRF